MRSIALVLLFFFTSCILRSQDKYYFYHGLEYGSESLINPGSLIFNSGLDILQSATHSRQLSKTNFIAGTKNVYRNLIDPFTQIRIYGWKRFIEHEIIPTSFSVEKAQWFPNYTLHLIGGGIDYRIMSEWYSYHGMPYPTLFAGLTVAVNHFVNETVETGLYSGPNVDLIADFYVFDIGGVILFSSDAVAEFFSSTLHTTVWPGQAAWNPEFNTIENHGQYYVMRYKLSFIPQTSLFIHFGDNGLFGLSYHQKNNESISVGAGMTQNQLHFLDIRNGARTVSVTLGWMAGIYYDRNNSLLFSAMVSSRTNEKLRLNLYPGVIDLWGFSPGFFVSIGSRNQFITGITFQYTPIGLAYRNKL